MSLTCFFVERKDGGEIGVAGVFENLEDRLKGGAVVGLVGETDDGPAVAGELDYEIVEAAGAAGVEEELGVL